MKMSVLYFSKSGCTKEMAEHIVIGMERAGDVEAMAMPIDGIDEAYVKESACVVVGSPTYYTSLAGEVKSFLDAQGGKLGLAGKLGGAFATANFAHGGGDIAILNILTHLAFRGMLIYSGGGTLGAPPIHLGPVALFKDWAAYAELFETYGERMAAKAKELF